MVTLWSLNLLIISFLKSFGLSEDILNVQGVVVKWSALALYSPPFRVLILPPSNHISDLLYEKTKNKRKSEIDIVEFSNRILVQWTG